MHYKIITSVRDSYKGWNFSVLKAYNNSDLQVTILPAVQLDTTRTDRLPIEERGKLMRDLMRKLDQNTHVLRVAAKETILFVFKVVPWENARDEAKKYIDKNLGAFDLNKFNSGK